MTEVFERDTIRTLDTVITFLEMTERTARQPRPAPLGKLAILRAETPTRSFYLWLYRAVGKDWNWTDRLVWPDDELLSVIHDAGIEIIVLYIGGVPAGFAELDFRREGTCELALFGLLPEYIGRGLGGYFLDWIIDATWRPGIARVLVDTNVRDHPRALAMYQKAGFRVVRREQAWLIPNAYFQGAYDMPPSNVVLLPRTGEDGST